MNEKFRVVPDNEKISVPTEGEVRAIIENIIGERTPFEVKRLEDGNGLYRLMIIATDGNGESVVYDYFREGKYPNAEVLETAIDVTFFDEDDTPCGGYRVTSYRNGVWETE